LSTVPRLPDPDEEFEVGGTTFAMIPGWVIETVSATDLRVYAHIAHRYLNQKREAWPSQARIAAELTMGLSTVEDSLRRLRESGAVIVTRTQRRDHKFGRNRYWLPMDHPRLARDGGVDAEELAEQDVIPAQSQPRESRVGPALASQGSGNQTQKDNQTNQKRAGARDAADSTPSLFEAGSKKKPGRTRAETIDPGWLPTQQYVDQVKAEGHFTREQYTAELNKFRNYHLGKGDKAVDFEPLFRNWLYRARADYKSRDGYNRRVTRPTEDDYVTTFGFDAEGNWSNDLKVRKVQR
jgi:predicted transcriptional regulator